MNRSESVTNLAAALAQAQGEFGKVVKGKTAEISAGRGYKYADLAAVCEAIIPVLSKHGIAVVQGSPADNLGVIETLLIHGKSGEWLSSFAPIYEGRNGGAQGYGSGVTYARRYALLAAAGVAPEDDDDGAKASGPDARVQKGASHAREGLRDAWFDAIEDSLPENATGRQRAEAYAAAIERDMQKMKSIRGIDGIWAKHNDLIRKIGDKHPDLHGNIIHVYETCKRAIDGAEEGEAA